MWFYGCLKGLSEEKVKAELGTLLEDVGLLHKRHDLTKNLSGKGTSLPSVSGKMFAFLTRNVVFFCLSVRWHAEKAVGGNSVCWGLKSSRSG